MKSAEQKAGIIEANLESRRSRTPQEQLDLLNIRLGAGQGAVRERARLGLLIQAEAEAKIKAEAQAPDVKATTKEPKVRGKPTKNKKSTK